MSDHDLLKQVEQARRDRDEAIAEVRQLKQWAHEATEGLQKWKAECDALRAQLATARAEALESAADHFCGLVVPNMSPATVAAILMGLATAPAATLNVPVLPIDSDAERRLEALLRQKVADAMERSKPHVADALKLGRSISGTDPSLAGVVIGAAKPPPDANGDNSGTD